MGLSTCFTWVPRGLPIWVPDPAHIFPRSCPHYRPYGPHIGLSTSSTWVPCALPIWFPDSAYIFPRFCPHFRPLGPYMVKHGLLMGPIWATIWGSYGQHIWAPYGFVHLFHMSPMWVAHMAPRFCPLFPQILPPISTHMDPIWVCHSVLYGSHVGSPHGSKILFTFSPGLAHISAHMGLIW